MSTDTKLANFSLRTWVIVILVLLVVILIIASVAMHEATRAHNRLNDFDNEIADALTGVGERTFGAGELFLFKDGSTRLVPLEDDDGINDLTSGNKNSKLGRPLRQPENLQYFRDGNEIDRDEMFRISDSLYNVTCKEDGRIYASNLLPGKPNESTEDNVGEGEDNAGDDGEGGGGSNADNGEGDGEDNGEGEGEDNGQGDGEVGDEQTGRFIGFRQLRLGRKEDDTLYLEKGQDSIRMHFHPPSGWPDLSDHDKSQVSVARVEYPDATVHRYNLTSSELSFIDNDIMLKIPISEGAKLYVNTNIEGDSNLFYEYTILVDITVEMNIDYADNTVQFIFSGVGPTYRTHFRGRSFQHLDSQSSQVGHKRTVQFELPDVICAENADGHLIVSDTPNNATVVIDVDNNNIGVDFSEQITIPADGLYTCYYLQREQIVINDTQNRCLLIDGLSERFKRWIGEPEPEFTFRVVDDDGHDVTGLFRQNIHNASTGQLQLVQDQNVTQPGNYQGFKLLIGIINSDRQSSFENAFMIYNAPLLPLKHLSYNPFDGLLVPSTTPWEPWVENDDWFVQNSVQIKTGDDDSWKPCSDSIFEKGKYYRWSSQYKNKYNPEDITEIHSGVEMVSISVPSVNSFDNNTLTSSDGVLRHRAEASEQYFYVDDFALWTDVEVTGGLNNAKDLLVYPILSDGITYGPNEDGKFQLQEVDVGYPITVKVKTPDNRLLVKTWATELTIDVNTHTNEVGRVYVGERVSSTTSNGTLNPIFRMILKSGDNDEDITKSNWMSEVLIEPSMYGKSFRLEYVDDSNPERRGTSDLYTVSHSSDIDILGDRAQLNALIPQEHIGIFSFQMRTATLDASGNEQWGVWEVGSEISINDRVKVQGQMVDSSGDVDVILPSRVFDVLSQ